MTCNTCINLDGTLNTDYLDDIAECVFGCGATIGSEDCYCPKCGDPSHNVAECDSCFQMFAQDYSGNGHWSLED